MDATLTDPLVDRVLDGRYTVEARIARGGMASVYLAVDRRLERRVAVKVMHPGLAEDHDFVARFNREARAAASLSHPDVVAVYDQGTDAGHVFLVMEYVPGATLRGVLRERGKLTPGEALAVMDHVLAALGAAHHAGLVHRDVKPENVLITADHRVKVADFGLARAVAETNLTGSGGVLLGTVAYLAPEQVERGVSDARTDVYAAGVMLFELLTGRPPFSGDTPIAVAYQRVREPVPAPSSVVPGIPTEIDALVASATALDPDARPADAGVLHAALRSVRDALNLHDRVPALSANALEAVRQAESTQVVRRPEAARGGDTQVVPVAAATAATAAPDPSAQPRRRRRRWPLVTAVVAVITLLAALGGWWLAAGRYVSAPGVLGLGKAAAETKLHDAGLKIRWLPAVYSDTVKKDLVADQNPDRGHHVLRGAVVSLALSRGPEMHAVPSVQGKPLGTATSMLTTARLKVGDVAQVWDDEVPKGAVVRSDPAPGTVVHAGTAVSLVVSKGPQPLPVPNVVGEDAGKATADLSTAGFPNVVTNEVYSDNVAKGKVMAQTPTGGQTVPRTTQITLTVSKGPQLFQVPDVRGMKSGDAKKQLQAAGFKVDVNRFPGGPDRVLSQSPGGGSMKPKGTTVTLYVF